MLETALEWRLELLAKRVSRVEERCQVQAEVFLQKSSSAEQLGAKLHEVSETLVRKADRQALEILDSQLHMLVCQVKALSNTMSMEAERSRAWPLCKRRSHRPGLKAASVTADVQGARLAEERVTGDDSLISGLDRASDVPLQSTGSPNMGAGAQPRTAGQPTKSSAGSRESSRSRSRLRGGESPAVRGGEPGQEPLPRTGSERRLDGQEPGRLIAAEGAAAVDGRPAPEAAGSEPRQDAELPAEEGAASRQVSVEKLNDRGQDLSPEEILRAVLSVEEMCSEELEGTAASSSLSVELLVDEHEPLVRYCACSSPDSPTVINVLSCEFPDTSIHDAVRALTSKDELAQWNSQGEFKVLRDARQDDVGQEHVVHFALKAPWPFWDRDVLQRRWRLPLPDTEASRPGVAVVMRSVTGDQSDLLREQQGVVRAFVYGAAFLLRPMADGKGTQLTYVNQIDIGGLIPSWAQGLLSRLASRGVVEWNQKLSTHLETMRNRRQPSW